MADDASAASDVLNQAAQGRLKSLIERIERLEEDKAVVANDLKEVFAEAKGEGFDVKVLREILRLRKLEQEYDPTDKVQAVSRLMESHAKGEVLTGVFYINAKAPSFIDMLNVTDQPLATLPESLTRPSMEALEQCMEELR